MKKYWILIVSVSLFLFSFFTLFAAIGTKVDYHFFFNSDSVIHAVMYKDFFEDKFSPELFYFPDSQEIVPDFLLYAIIKPLTGNFRIALILTSFVILALVFVMLWLIFRNLYEKVLPEELSLAILFSALCVLSVAYGHFKFLSIFFIVPYMHVGTLLMSLILLFLVIKSLDEKKLRYLIVILVVTLATVTYDKLLLMHFVIPCILTLFLTSILCRKNNATYRFLLIVELVVASLVGLYLYRFTTRLPINRPLSLHIRSISALSRDFGALLKGDRIELNFAAVDYSLQDDVLPVVIVALLYFIISLFLTLRFSFLSAKGEKQNSKLFFFISFTCFLFVSDIVGTIGGDLYNSFIHMRYLSPLFLLPPISFFLLLPIARRRPFYQEMVWALNIFLVFTVAVNIKLPNMGQINTVANYKPEITKCLDAVSDKYLIKYGLSDYWPSHQITMFSDRGVKALASEIKPIGIRPVFWNNNFDWYIWTDSSREHLISYRFILARSLDPASLATFAGDGYATETCGNDKVLIATTPEAISKLNGSMNAYTIFRRLNNVGDEVDIDASDFRYMLIDETVTASPTIGMNLISTGPYIQLRGGTYTFTINYDTASKGQGTVGYCYLKKSKTETPSFYKTTTVSLTDSGSNSFATASIKVPFAPLNSKLSFYGAESILVSCDAYDEHEVKLKNLLIEKID